MEDLIKALQILLKYGNPQFPTHCEHDELTICGIEPSIVSEADRAMLEALSFHNIESEACFRSFRFGSA